MLQRIATGKWQQAGFIAALAFVAGGSFRWSGKSLAHLEERKGKVLTF